MNRREFVAASVAASTLALRTESDDADSPIGPLRISGRLKQSVCRWCYGGMPLDDLCSNAAKMGFKSVELLGEKEWFIPAKHGLTCALANGPTSIPNGFNRLENHDKFVNESERLLPLIKEAGIPQMIVFSGNRKGQSDAEGLKNCTTGLKRITPLAEKLGITIVMELLNSKVDHKEYQCDHTVWGVELIKQVDSTR